MDDITECPVARFGQLRERGPVVQTPWLDDGTTTYMVTRDADVRAALTDPRLRADAGSVDGARALVPDLLAMIGIPADMEFLGKGLLTRDGDDHTRLRKLVSRAFTVRRVGGLRPRVEALTAGLLDDVAAAGADGGPVDLIPAFTYPLPVAVICELVGVPVDQRDRWRELAGLLVAPDPERIGGVIGDVVAQLRSLIADRRAEPRDDLLTGLVQAHDDGDRLTETEVLTLVFDILSAGFETTAHLLSKSIKALLTRPEQLAALRADPGLWPRAVHELVRTCGPIPTSLPRYAATDVEIGDVTVPRAGAVMAALLSANFDPRAHDRPDELDVRREAGRGEGHVGFGQGPHYCLGAALARQETEVALRALVERFDGLRLDPGTGGEAPDAQSELGFMRLTELPVRLH